MECGACRFVGALCTRRGAVPCGLVMSGWAPRCPGWNQSRSCVGNPANPFDEKASPDFPTRDLGHSFDAAEWLERIQDKAVDPFLASYHNGETASIIDH